MRTIWTVISTVAVANVLALIGFVAWLGMTDRLSRERIERVRVIFATTVQEQAAAEAAEEARTRAEAEVQAAAQRMAAPPEPAAARIAQQQEAEEVRLQHVLRQQRELEDLRRTLERDRARLIEDENRLARAQQEFEEYRRRLAEIEGADQFKKALATLESQKPKDAKDVLQVMIDQRETEQVIAYLGAMDDRARGKIMAEFVKSDPRLAAELLERLRTRGTKLADAEAPAP